MLGLRKKMWLLIVINVFPDAIAIGIVGVVMEIIYRVLSCLGLLEGGLELLPLSGCLGVAFVIFLLRFPAAIKIIRSHSKRE
ncbi:hypothetical protein EBB59_01420 [Lysobacter pythonis]|uniref:Uncharacterized protein n=1 Tax=Solilutibacter pythonis TaxID=2483112 RepID=A0A3M2I4L6_9GAMM|nr:hypothetical protein EBB59_01420 [Lysobacter pythonis]